MAEKLKVSQVDMLVEAERRGLLSEEEAPVLQRARDLGIVGEPVMDSVMRGVQGLGAGLNRGALEGIPVGQGATELMLKGANKGFINTDTNMKNPFSRIPFNVGRTVGQTIAPTGMITGAARGLATTFGKGISKELNALFGLSSPKTASALSPADFTGTVQAQQAPFVKNVAEQLPKVLGTEALTAGTAGIGGAVAREMTGQSELGGMAGEIGGGFAPGILQLMGVGARGVARGIGDIRGTQKSIDRNTANALELDAVDVSGTLNKIKERLDDPDRIIVGTTGKITGNAGILARERGLRTTDPVPFIERDAMDAERLRESTQRIAEGRPADTSEFFEARIEDINKNINNRLDNAVNEARIASENVSPKLTRDEAGTLLADEVTKEYEGLLANQRRAWDDVGTTDYNAVGVKERAAAIINGRAKNDDPRDFDPVLFEVAGVSRVKNIPKGLVDESDRPVAREQFSDESSLDDVESLDEIQALRSRVLNAARRERGKGAKANKNRLRHLNDLGDAIFGGLTPENVSDPAVLERFNKARAASKTLHDKTSEGPIADILAKTSRGNQVMDPVLATSKVTPGGQTGGVAFRAVEKLVGELEGSASGNAIAEFMMTKFKSAAIPDGKSLKVDQAKKFLSDNQETLNSLPGLRDGLRSAIAAEEVAGMTQASSVVLQRALTQTAAARFIKGDPERMLSEAIASRNPTRSITSLVQSAKRDPSGKALEGLRRTFVNIFTEKISPQSGPQMGSGTNLEGPRVRASAARGFVAKHSREIQILFPSSGLAKFKRIAKEATMAERDAVGSSGSPTAQNMASVSTLGRMIGARVGPILGVPSLVATGTGGRIAQATLGSKRQQEVAARIEEAVLNPRLWRELMKNIPAENAKAAARLEGRVNAFLIGAFAPEVPIGK